MTGQTLEKINANAWERLKGHVIEIPRSSDELAALAGVSKNLTRLVLHWAVRKGYAVAKEQSLGARVRTGYSCLKVAKDDSALSTHPLTSPC